jgi:hypothetical protein
MQRRKQNAITVWLSPSGQTRAGTVRKAADGQQGIFNHVIALQTGRASPNLVFVDILEDAFPGPDL